MKKTLFKMILVIFVTVSFSGQAWAMGSAKKRGGQGRNIQGLNNLFSGHGNAPGNRGNFNSAHPHGNDQDNDNSENNGPHYGRGHHHFHHGNNENSDSSENIDNNEDEDDSSSFDGYYFFSEREDIVEIESYGSEQNENNQFLTDQIDENQAHPIPEPMTLSLMGIGLAGIFLKRKEVSKVVKQ